MKRQHHYRPLRKFLQKKKEYPEVCEGMQSLNIVRELKRTLARAYYLQQSTIPRVHEALS